MGNPKAKGRRGVQVEDGEEKTLHELGKQLLKLQKYNKEAALKLLKAIYDVLKDAPQNSPSLKHASNDAIKALMLPEVCKHKDKEVRLYATGCMLYALKLHAPDSPFSDPQMETFFTQLIAAFRELHDPSGAHFELRKSLLEIAAELKCCLLIYDLTDNTEALVLELFTSLLDALNSENLHIIQKPILLLLSSMVDDGEEPSQQLLDTILGRILPSTSEENLAAHHLTDALIRRCQSALQPSVQKFLTHLLEGRRTESELAGHCSDLILALHKTVPQITLPVLPHLAPSLVVDSEERRLDAVDLIASLLTATGAQSLLEDYPALPEALLGRLNDRCASIRVQVLSHAQSLIAASNTDELRRSIITAVSHRLQDPDEKVRIKGVQSLVSIVTEHPLLMSKEDLAALTARLRDKRLPVRKVAATQTAKLIRSWTLRWEDAFDAPQVHKRYVAQLALGLYTVAVSHDVELSWHIIEDVFRNNSSSSSNSSCGLFSPKVSVSAAAGWWAVIWKAGNKVQRASIFSLLQNRFAVQSQVRELLQLRDAIKSAKRQDEGDDNASPMLQQGQQGQMEMGLEVGGAQDKEQGPLQKQLERGLSHLGGYLGNRVRVAEGLQRIWAMKDNNIFKALTVLADHGTPGAEAHAAGKELISRVGSRGAVAEAALALVSRMVPTVVSPEVLGAALEATHDQSSRCDYGFDYDDEFLLDIAGTAPQLFAALLPTLSKLLTSDDQVANEVAAKVLSKAGHYVGVWTAHMQQEIPPSTFQALAELCTRATPAGAKAAVKSIVQLEQGLALQGKKTNDTSGLLKEIATKALRALGNDNNNGILSSHSRVLACLKAISSVLRAMPESVEDVGLEFYDFVMNDLLIMDMSSGKPLAGQGALKDGQPSWECPSPDVQIKTAALRTLAQAFVPDDPEAQPSSTTLKILEVFIPKLVDLTDVDTDAPCFEGFRWRLASVKWVHGKSVDDETLEAGDAVTYDWNEYGSEEREQLEKQARDASPDAGWVRFAAGAALCRLMRAYDGQMTGNDYMSLALICQDPLAEVRRAFLEQISKAVAHFQPASNTKTRPNPQRAAKMAALWAIFAADPVEENCRLAFAKLREFVFERRSIVDKISLAAATAGKSGSLMNEMPELILPFLIYLMAHHPDYDSTELFDDEAQSVPGENEPTVLQFLRNALQLGLEALIVPASELGKEEAAIEVANTAALSLKLLRSIKYCDALSLEATPREGEVDEVATERAHQVCDIAVFIAREILRRVMGGTPRPLNKFPGRVAIPKLCFRMQPTDEKAHKRKDGSDIPGRFRPALGKLFTDIFAPGGGVGGEKMAGPGARQVKNKARALDTRKGPRSSNHPSKRLAKASVQLGANRSRAARKRAREEVLNPVLNPVRQQPRREAKDAAAAILLSGDDGHEDDEHEDSDYQGRSGNNKYEKESPGCGPSLSADAGQNSHEVPEVSLGQENGNKLNMASVYSDSSERHGKATDVISGAKAKRARG